MELINRRVDCAARRALRAMVREVSVSAQLDFHLPAVFTKGTATIRSVAMPGALPFGALMGWWRGGRAWDLGNPLRGALPKVADGLKSEDGAECFNEGGLNPRAIRRPQAGAPGRWRS